MSYTHCVLPILRPFSPAEMRRRQIRRGAGISADGKYRYYLYRRWCAGAPTMLWLMLNPSTADGTADDPTIRKCIGFASRAGYGGIEVVNLFAFRSTDPDALLPLPEAERVGGSASDRVILDVAMRCTAIVCGWGAIKKPLRTRAADVVDALRHRRLYLHCLGATKEGQPRHPLFVPYSTPFEMFTL